MFYIFPFENLITVEFRRYNPGATGDPDRHIWPLRNYLWATGGPAVCAQAEADLADKTVRYKVIDGVNALWRFKLENLIKSDNTVPPDQIIRYPPVGGASKYTFSLWAFPEETYPTVLAQHFQFCQQYYQTVGYRNNMLFVGYYIAKDQNSLLSYSYDGDVMTIDPISTGNPGWFDFLAAYNQVCGDAGGIPLPEPDLRHHGSAIQEGARSAAFHICGGAAEVRPERATVERVFPRFAGRRRCGERYLIARARRDPRHLRASPRTIRSV